MTDASQVRINELARELEVKAKAIIDVLPEVGLTEKKTHSSSVPVEIAEKVRQHFHSIAEAERSAEAAAKAEKEARDPAAKAARMKPAASPAPAVRPAAPVPGKPAAPAPAGVAAAKPAAPARPITPPAAAAKPAAPAGPARPAASPSAPTIPASAKPAQPSATPAAQPSVARPAAAPARPGGRPPAAPEAPPPAGARPASPATARPSAAVGPRPGQPMRPLATGNRGPLPSSTRSSAPSQGRPYGSRPGAVPAGTRPGPRMPGRPSMLPPLPDKRPPKAEPGKPLYTRKPPPRRRPVIDKREAEGERKLHPVRQRPGVGDRRGAVIVPVAPPEPRPPREVTITEGITIRELAEKLDIRAKDLLKELLDRGVFASINQALDIPTAKSLAESFSGVVTVISLEEEMVLEVAKEEKKENLKPRPPVVTVMGHVDHGKTSLLDAIRETEVAAGEAGGITQHIGAYKVPVNGRSVVFVDTPGHEAFTRMRSRGAKVTDIVVLVVAADDGVMPQTLEAIDHARAAGAPIIVAVNKIDKPNAQPERVKQQLADRGLQPEEWGGDTVMVNVSAKLKTNLDLLLEMILLVADLQDLKANPDRPGMGTVLEAKLDRGRGPGATVLVRNGTLRVGDYFICGLVFGKVRAMLDDRGQPVREVEPSMPVEVLGLESLPEAGDPFQVVTDTAKAKQIVIYREAKAREIAMAKNKRLTLDQLHQQMQAGEVKELPIILKADVSGSAEVVSETLQKLSNEKVKIRVLHSGVGAITESDVLLASASNAIIIGFNVRPERNAASVAEQEKVDIRLHTIIYNLTDEIKKAMTGLLSPVFKEIYKGKAEVRETFRVSKVGAVAGCVVLDGTLTRSSEVRVLRDNVVIHTGRIGSLRRVKDDGGEVKGR